MAMHYFSVTSPALSPAARRQMELLAAEAEKREAAGVEDAAGEVAAISEILAAHEASRDAAVDESAETPAPVVGTLPDPRRASRAAHVGATGVEEAAGEVAPISERILASHDAAVDESAEKTPAPVVGTLPADPRRASRAARVGAAS